MNVTLVAFGVLTLNVCVCKCFWCKCVKRKTIKKMRNLHGNSSGTVKKLFPTLLKKKQTMYFITVT